MELMKRDICDYEVLAKFINAINDRDRNVFRKHCDLLHGKAWFAEWTVEN